MRAWQRGSKSLIWNWRKSSRILPALEQWCSIDWHNEATSSLFFTTELYTMYVSILSDNDSKLFTHPFLIIYVLKTFFYKRNKVDSNIFLSNRQSIHRKKIIQTYLWNWYWPIKSMITNCFSIHIFNKLSTPYLHCICVFKPRWLPTFQAFASSEIKFKLSYCRLF